MTRQAFIGISMDRMSLQILLWFYSLLWVDALIWFAFVVRGYIRQTWLAAINQSIWHYSMRSITQVTLLKFRKRIYCFNWHTLMISLGSWYFMVNVEPSGWTSRVGYFLQYVVLLIFVTTARLAVKLRSWRKNPAAQLELPPSSKEAGFDMLEYIVN